MVRAGSFCSHFLAVLLLSGGGSAVAQSVVAQSVAVPSLGHRPFPNARDPPAYARLNEQEQAQFELGHAVFNTRWVPAGTPGAARRDGLGPLYNAAACDACHNEAARGRGPSGAGPAPAALVVQLERPTPDRGPDPVYGYVLNTAALNGVAPEASVSVEYREIAGAYPDGTPWALRAPTYALSQLRYGPLAPDTILKPRIAPALFGIGLLEAVPQDAILGVLHGASSSSRVHGTPAWHEYRGARALGRFGWQGASVSIRDQTTKAFSRDMGLTTSDRPTDDCTIAETDCRAAPNGGEPEVSAELLDAVVAFQHALAVPESTATVAGSMLPEFERLGCADCHRPSLPVRLEDAAGHMYPATIEPYTDLLLHDLGAGLADSDLSAHPVPSRWRTAPLWGIAHNSRPGTRLTGLHDGRARSIEEAILWHHGEAQRALGAFERLDASQRQALIAWIETL